MKSFILQCKFTKICNTAVKINLKNEFNKYINKL